MTDQPEQQRTRRWCQQRLHEVAPANVPKFENIDPSGDLMQERTQGDGVIRYGYQNIRGSDLEHGLETATEVDMMLELGIDVQGLSECNRPWTKKNKAQYDHMMEAVFENPVLSTHPHRLQHTSIDTNMGEPFSHLRDQWRDGLRRLDGTSGGVTAGRLHMGNETRAFCPSPATEYVRMHLATRGLSPRTNSNTASCERRGSGGLTRVVNSLPISGRPSTPTDGMDFDRF